MTTWTYCAAISLVAIALLITVEACVAKTLLMRSVKVILASSTMAFAIEGFLYATHTWH